MNFKILFDCWECVVFIADNDDTVLHLQEMLFFWSGGQECLDAADGDVKKAWLTMFAEHALYLSQRKNLSGLIDSFEDIEGWYPLDGSFGIRVVTCDSWEFDATKLEITAA